MHLREKYLLIRADFVLGNRLGGNRLACKRWRRLLTDALPSLMGCAHRCPASSVRLHKGEGEGSFTGWLRIPIERRPSRRRRRKFEAKVRARLEAGLLPIDGRVVRLGVRRCVTRIDGPRLLPLLPVQTKEMGQLELFDPHRLEKGPLESAGSIGESGRS